MNLGIDKVGPLQPNGHGPNATEHEGLVECEYCGKRLPEDDMKGDPEGLFICKPCQTKAFELLLAYRRKRPVADAGLRAAMERVRDWIGDCIERRPDNRSLLTKLCGWYNTLACALSAAPPEPVVPVSVVDDFIHDMERTAEHGIKETKSVLEQWVKKLRGKLAPYRAPEPPAASAPEPVTPDVERLCANAETLIAFIRAHFAQPPAPAPGPTDTERLDWLAQERYSIHHADGKYWLEWVINDKRKRIGDYHLTPRAAIDTAMKGGEGDAAGS